VFTSEEPLLKKIHMKFNIVRN